MNCPRCGHDISRGFYCINCGYIPVWHSTVKKNTREGAERLMLAVLVDAIEYFQQYLFAADDKGKHYSTKPKNGFWIKIAIGSIPLRISVRSYS